MNSALTSSTNTAMEPSLLPLLHGLDQSFADDDLDAVVDLAQKIQAHAIQEGKQLRPEAALLAAHQVWCSSSQQVVTEGQSDVRVPFIKEDSFVPIIVTMLSSLAVGFILFFVMLFFTKSWAPFAGALSTTVVTSVGMTGVLYWVTGLFDRFSMKRYRQKIDRQDISSVLDWVKCLRVDDVRRPILEASLAARQDLSPTTISTP